MSVHTWTVDEVCAGVFAALEATFPDEFWVRGEIQGLRKSPAGHLYFDLIEPGARGRGQDAKLSTVAFRGPLRGIEAVLRKVGNLQLADGMEVRVRGKIDFYPPQGRVQFMMSAIDPRHTLGQLSADRDRVMRSLGTEGLLDRNQRLDLSLVPLRVGLVTSDDSAAYNDFVEELSQSPFSFTVVFADARVQGAEAEPTLVAAIETLYGRELDVIAVVRGGGAKGDLLAFDRELVARAVAMSPVPVLVGIGHEIDRSIVDEVAHGSLKTPTACAAALVDRVSSFVLRLDQLAAAARHHADRVIRVRADRLEADAARLRRATTATLSANRITLEAHSRTLTTGSSRVVDLATTRLGRDAGRAVASTGIRLTQSSAELQQSVARLPGIATRALAVESARVEAANTVVKAVHPDRTLSRGYSITRNADGVAVRSSTEVAHHEVLRTQLLDGIVESTVTKSVLVQAEPTTS